MKPRILVIVGPTASGKSALAVKLAKKFNGEIISADSRQVYKGLDIGTGKITRKERRGISHHLLDVARPKRQFSVSEYVTITNQAIAKIVEKRKSPIVVGGTGFYIDAITNKVSLPEVPPNKKLRAKLEKKSLEELFKLLKKKDPSRARTIDTKNKVRLIRALEIVEALGKVPELANSLKLSAYSFVYIGLNPKDLDKRIYERLIERLPGIVREVKRLRKQGLSWKRLHELGLEYRYVSMYVHGYLHREEMVEKLYGETRKYAKRQMTWFKRNKEIKWFTSESYKVIGRKTAELLR